MNVESVSHERANSWQNTHLPEEHPFLKDQYIEPKYTGELPDFGFTFIIKRGTKHVIQTRRVYTILVYLASIGGTVKIFETLFKPLLGYILPQPLSRDVLNKNFKFDEVLTDASLVEQMKDVKAPFNLRALSSAPERLQRFLITYWNTIMLAHFSCCAKRDR